MTHKLIELVPELRTFSIGENGKRRTIICHAHPRRDSQMAKAGKDDDLRVVRVKFEDLERIAEKLKNEKAEVSRRKEKKTDRCRSLTLKDDKELIDFL